MKRKITRRERWFLAFAPALLMSAVFVFGLYRPMRAQTADAQRRLASAGQDSPSEGLISARRRIIRDLQNRVDALTRGRGNDQELPLQARSDADESVAVARVTQVLRDNSVLVVESVRLSEQEGRAIPPQDVVAAIDAVGPASARGYWRWSVVGTFAGVRESLNAIESLSEWIVPLQIGMEAAPDGHGIHRWSLLMWM